MTIQYTFGTSGNDYLHGRTDYLDGSVIYGYGGNDVLVGTANRDSLYAGPGNDWLDGNGARYGDWLAGGPGNDTYVIRSSYDAISEGPDAGRDTVLVTVPTYTMPANVEVLYQAPEDQYQVNWGSMTGNSLNNEMSGNQSNNTLYGGYGNDSLWGNQGDDKLYGGENSDKIAGGEGNDFLDGGPGNDTMWGEAGNDVFKDLLGYNTIVGGLGDDTAFLTQRGSDQLWGNEGSDTFIWESWGAKGYSFSAIEDFQVGADKLSARPGVDISARANGSGTMVTFSNNVSTHDVSLVGVSLDQFNSSGGISGNLITYFGS